MLPISIICPIYNEINFIENCIDSVLKSDYPQELIELILVDGLSTDGTREIIQRYQKEHSQIVLLDNPQQIVSPALNMGIKRATGDFIFRIDAHATYPSNYFSVLLEKMIALKADNVGGVCLTLPANSSNKSSAIATALSSPFGMGNSYFRIGSKSIRQVDTVPFGCFSKEIFQKIGYFDEELIRNQDDEFNGRIIKNGGKIYLIPSIETAYFARDTLCKTKKMFYQYGLFKPLVNKKLGFPMTIRQLVPPFFILWLILGAVCSLFHSSFSFLYLATLSIYFITNLSFSIFESIKQRRKIGILGFLSFTFFVIHLSYGWGYLVGIFKLLTKKPFISQSNR